MKTRTIVWTIVGIVVVAAVIFTIIARRGSTPTGPRLPRTMAEWEKEYQNMVRRVEKFEASYQRVKNRIGTPTPEETNIMSQIDATIQEWKTEVEKFNELQTDEERKEWRDKVIELRKQAMKLLRQLRKGGEESEEEE